MSVLLETSEGDIVIDLLVDQCPKICTNFLKLCKVKYYNFSPFYNVQKNFTCQTGDPYHPKGDGGNSIWGLINGKSRVFTPEYDVKTNRHEKTGTVSMPFVMSEEEDDTGSKLRFAKSQFIITLADGLSQLDERAAVFGHIVEGFDSLNKINNAFCDQDGRPLKDIRIKHTYILEDPFDDPEGIDVPPNSPDPTDEQLATVRIGEDEEQDVDEDEETAERRRKEQESRAQALTLEMVGDLPFAEMKPAENILFVCKLNPITQDEDLQLIFSRFGPIVSCEIVRDKQTGDSLQYAFIEFENKQDCERAYFKMDGVLIDDRRIHVDFSQSVSKLSDSWRTQANDKRKAHHGSMFVESQRRTERERSPDRHSYRTDRRDRRYTPDRAERQPERHRRDYSPDRRRRDYSADRKYRDERPDKHNSSDSKYRRHSPRRDRYERADRYHRSYRDERRR